MFLSVVLAVIALFSCACGTAPNGTEREQKPMEEIFPAVSASVAAVKTDYNQGTGFVALSEENKMYLITNKHVFERDKTLICETATLEFFDGRIASGKLIGYDSYHDIAVIVADAFSDNAVSPINFTSEELVYAQKAFIIGNALGQGLGVFDGIISVPDQKLSLKDEKKTVPVVQTTIPINSGCSGGPVFDLYGNVIGVGVRQTCFDPFDENRPVDGVSYFVSSFIAEKILRQAVAENGSGELGARELFKLECTLGENGNINFTGLLFSGKVGKDGITVTSSTLEFGSEKLEAGDVITHIGNVSVENRSNAFVMSTVMNYLLRDSMPQVADWGDIITLKFKRGDIVRNIHRQGIYEKKY